MKNFLNVKTSYGKDFMLNVNAIAYFVRDVSVTGCEMVTAYLVNGEDVHIMMSYDSFVNELEKLGKNN
jgi:hypothetical protein